MPLGQYRFYFIQLVRHIKYTLPAVAFLIVFSLCIMGLSNPYYFDDFIVIRDNAYIYQNQPWIWFSSPYIDSAKLFPGYRPLLMLTFWLTRVLFGASVEIFRMGNILLHLANGFMFYQLLTRSNFKLENKVILFCTLVFLLHPVQTLPINFIWKRSTLLETFLILGGLLFHEGYAWRNKYVTMTLHSLIYVCAMGVKESGVIYPVWILLYELLFKSNRQTYQIYFFSSLSFIILGSQFFVFRFAQHPEVYKAVHDIRQTGTMDYFLWSLAEVPNLLLNLVWPMPRLIEDPPKITDLNAFMFMPISFLGCLAILLCVRFRHYPWVVIGLVMSVVSLIPTNTLFPLYFVSDQIRLYVAVMGFSLGLGHVLHHAIQRQKLKIILATSILIFYGFLFCAQMLRYQTPQNIWQDVIEAYPESGLAWGELGGVLQAQKKYRESGLAFLLAAKYEKTKPGHMIRAVDNMLKSSLPHSTAKQMIDDLPMKNMTIPDWVNLSMVFVQLGEFDRAEKILHILIESYPNFSPSFQRLGMLYEVQQKWPKARVYYQKALGLNPADSVSAQRLKIVSSKQ